MEDDLFVRKVIERNFLHFKCKIKTIESTGKWSKKEKSPPRSVGDINRIDAPIKSAETLFDLYGNRWTVETSYRVLGEVRTKTASRMA